MRLGQRSTARPRRLPRPSLLNTPRSFQVKVISSSLDEFVEAVRGDGAWDGLPRVTSDLSDTWIWGVGSDPLKVAKTRAMLRSRSRCELEHAHNQCTESDVAFLNFSRFALKNIEHTWGALCVCACDWPRMPLRRLRAPCTPILGCDVVKPAALVRRRVGFTGCLHAACWSQACRYSITRISPMCTGQTPTSIATSQIVPLSY
jgi:hypothetical protein